MLEQTTVFVSVAGDNARFDEFLQFMKERSLHVQALRIVKPNTPEYKVSLFIFLQSFTGIMGLAYFR